MTTPETYESKITLLINQLNREGENSKYYMDLFYAMKEDRDAWKRAYLELKQSIQSQ